MKNYRQTRFNHKNMWRLYPVWWIWYGPEIFGEPRWCCREMERAIIWGQPLRCWALSWSVCLLLILTIDYSHPSPGLLCPIFFCLSTTSNHQSRPLQWGPWSPHFEPYHTHLKLPVCQPSAKRNISKSLELPGTTRFMRNSPWTSWILRPLGRSTPPKSCCAASPSNQSCCGAGRPTPRHHGARLPAPWGSHPGSAGGNLRASSRARNRVAAHAMRFPKQRPGFNQSHKVGK